jgi:hypothetical protein
MFLRTVGLRTPRGILLTLKFGARRFKKKVIGDPVRIQRGHQATQRRLSFVSHRLEEDKDAQRRRLQKSEVRSQKFTSSRKDVPTK